MSLCEPSKGTLRCYTSICDGIIFLARPRLLNEKCFLFFWHRLLKLFKAIKSYSRLSTVLLSSLEQWQLICSCSIDCWHLRIAVVTALCWMIDEIHFPGALTIPHLSYKNFAGHRCFLTFNSSFRLRYLLVWNITKCSNILEVLSAKLWRNREWWHFWNDWDTTTWHIYHCGALPAPSRALYDNISIR